MGALYWLMLLGEVVVLMGALYWLILLEEAVL